MTQRGYGKAESIRDRGGAHIARKLYQSSWVRRARQKAYSSSVSWGGEVFVYGNVCTGMFVCGWCVHVDFHARLKGTEMQIDGVCVCLYMCCRREMKY